MYAYPEGFTSNGGNVTTDDENLDGRMVATYAGITTSLASPIANATTDEVSLTNIARQKWVMNMGSLLLLILSISRYALDNGKIRINYTE